MDQQLKFKLKNLKISVWDIIQANSGGHKCITNISGLNYLKEPVKATKLLQQDFVKLLKQKVKEARFLMRQAAQQIVKDVMSID